jgi:outer membrane immunogenic protein
MKTVIRALAVLAVCAAASPAIAADVPMKAPRTAPMATTYNWTGIYVGGTAGYSKGHLKSNNDTTINHEPDGILGGVHMGANWQWNWIVLGVEADLALTNIDGEDNTSLGAFNVDVDSKMKYLGTVRGRLGVAIDRTLLYMTGGYAYSEIDGRIRVTLGGVPVVSGSDQISLQGWTIGAGIEHAVTNNVIVRVEYLYVDFGTNTSTVNLGFAFQDTFKWQSHIARAGLSWKF